VPVAAGFAGDKLLIHDEAYDLSAQSDHGGTREQSPVTSKQHQQRVRAAAVACQFYPRDPKNLRAVVEQLLAKAGTAPVSAPKAIIVPHAGYPYSGEAAATAFATLQDHTQPISRVVIIGPAHYVRFRGLAVPTVDAFETPLGHVPVAQDAMAALESLGSVVRADAPHVPEHALEVELPFLQTVLQGFELMPILIGEASPQEVAEVLGQLWGGPETLILVSSDLSHFHSYEVARRLDAVTAAQIERGDWASLGPNAAFGYLAVAGLLIEATRRGLTIKRLSLCNSGDTAGPRDQVVGYGAWAFVTPRSPGREQARTNFASVDDLQQ
jgi:AmmeMemoRadiSam system protein B